MNKSINVDRFVIPRWRLWTDTLRTGELGSGHVKHEDRSFARDVLVERRNDWSRERSLGTAADLVNTAVVAQNCDLTVREAANFLLESDTASAPLKRLAQTCLGFDFSTQAQQDPALTGKVEEDRKSLRQAIAAARSLLIRDPRNALAYVDAAHGYAAFGQLASSITSMSKAISLAPKNRFVLRSASRLFFHTGDLDRALDLLRGSELLKTDPWLLAAEIALSGAGAQKSKYEKRAFSVASGTDFEPFHIAELASALATLELGNGNVKGAKKLFRRSLEEPTENAMAQVLWAAPKTFLELDPTRVKAVNNAYEVQMRLATQAQNWQGALDACWEWVLDEPFSARPIQEGCHIAFTALRDSRLAEDLVIRGRMANPRNFTIMNNYVVCLAMRGALNEAARIYKQIIPDERSNYGIWVATRGLIAYRAGQPQVGWRLYEDSMALFEQLQDERSHALASLWRAREEMRIRGPRIKEAVHRARQLVDKLTNAPEYFSWLEELEKELLRAPSADTAQTVTNPDAEEAIPMLLGIGRHQ